MQLAHKLTVHSGARHNFGFGARRGENMKKFGGEAVKDTVFIVGEQTVVMT